MQDLAFLYVEDDPMSREALRIVFERIMHVEHIYIFEDGIDFLERVRALPRMPQIILLDIHMQPLNGFELLAQLRADASYQTCKIIALTASVMSEEVNLLKQKGFDGVIGKPINALGMPALLERIAAGEKVWHVSDF